MKKFYILPLLVLTATTLITPPYLSADTSDDWTTPSSTVIESGSKTVRGVTAQSVNDADSAPGKVASSEKTDVQGSRGLSRNASGQMSDGRLLRQTATASRLQSASEGSSPERLRYFILCPQSAFAISNQTSRNLSNAAQAAATISAIVRQHSSTANVRNRYKGLAFCGVSVEGAIEPAARAALESAGYSLTIVEKVSKMLDTSVDAMQARRVQVNDGVGTIRTATGRGIEIGIVDTGIDYTHPQLGGCTREQFLQRECEVVVNGYDFVANDPDPMDDEGHGTHVAATAGGRLSPEGVAPQARLVGLKSLDQTGLGFSDDVVAALEWALDPNGDGNTSDRLDVVNLSLGSLANPGDELSRPLSVAAQALVRQGVVVVAAAGNEGGSSNSPRVICPACAPSVLAVAATTNTVNFDELETGWFSSWGSYRAAAGLVGKPELSAPGVDICAARAQGAYSFIPACNEDVGRVSLFGTSMASPHIAGAAALLLELFPGSTALEIRQMLMNQARSFGGTQLARAGLGIVQMNALSQSAQYPPVIELAPLPDVPADGAIQINGTISSRRGIKSITILAARSATDDFRNLVEIRTIPLNDAPQNYALSASIVLPDVFAATQSIVVRVKDQGGIVSSAWTEARTIKPNFVNPEYLEAIKTVNPFGGDPTEGYAISIHPNTPVLPISWSLRDLGRRLREKGSNPLKLPRNSLFELIGTQSMNGRSRSFSTFVQGDSHLAFNSPLGVVSDPTLIVGNQGYLVGSALADNSRLLYTIAARCNSLSDYQNRFCSLTLLAHGANGTVRWSAPIGGTNDSRWAPPVEIKTPSVHGVFTLSQCNSPSGCRVLGLDAATGAVLPGWNDSPATGLGEFAFPTIHTVPSADGMGFKVVLLARYRMPSREGTQVDRVYVFNANGELAQRWSPSSNSDPLFLSGENLGLPAFGNFDADPELEIAFMNAAPNYIPYERERSAIYLYNLDGSLLNGWPRELDGTYIMTNTVAADLDRDGRDELIAQTACGSQISSDCRAVHAFKSDGTIVPGWPAQLGSPRVQESRSLAVADVDRDGSVETLACYGLRGCILLNSSGQPYRQSPSWPKEFLYQSDGAFDHITGGPFIADVNNDGEAEILIVGFSGSDDLSTGTDNVNRWKLIVLSAQGEELSAFEQFVPSALTNRDARWQLGDWNNDGIVELHAGGRPIAIIAPDQSLRLSRLSGHFVHTAATPFSTNAILWNGAGGDRRRLNRAGSGF